MQSDLWGEATITGDEIKNVQNSKTLKIGEKSGVKIVMTLCQISIDAVF